MKYSANRCNDRLGADLENKLFQTKVDALKWAKKCQFAKVRKISDREIVFSKGF